jgi:small subunit ribosomal protein S16
MLKLKLSKQNKINAKRLAAAAKVEADAIAAAAPAVEEVTEIVEAEASTDPAAEENKRNSSINL